MQEKVNHFLAVTDGHDSTWSMMQKRSDEIIPKYELMLYATLNSNVVK